MASKLPPERFPYTYVLDSEYQHVGGKQQKPVCLEAYGFNKGRRIEVFFNTPAVNPFPDLGNSLFIGYNLPSELKTLLALGWPLPAHCIDLYVEFLNMINGEWRDGERLVDLGAGLVDAVKAFGGNPMDFWKTNKEVEQNYILQHGTVPPEGVTSEAHRNRILAYCEEDITATVWLAQQMATHLDIDQALWRGAFTKAVAFFEHNGLPVDSERFRAIERESSKLKLSIANKIEGTHNFGVYVVEGGETKK